VVHAEVRTKTGDTLTGPLDSSIYAGVVVIHADDATQLTARITHIDDLFHIHTTHPAEDE
jgi:hypothetical protein